MKAEKRNPLVRAVWLDWIARKAGNNLDKWGVQDFETLGLAVCEEAGELAQAILQNKYEKGKRGRISHEALDLAALCVQVLVTMSQKHGAADVWNALFKKHSPNASGEGRPRAAGKDDGHGQQT